MSTKRYDFYEKLYFFEHDRHHKLNGTIATRAGTLAVVIGGIAYLANAVPLTKGYGVADWTLVFMLGVVAILVAFGIVQLAIAVWGKDYGFFPSTAEFEEARAASQAWYEAHEPGVDAAGAAKKADADADAAVLARLIECADHSAETNNTKSMQLHRATSATLAAILALGLAFPVFLFTEPVAAVTKPTGTDCPPCPTQPGCSEPPPGTAAGAGQSTGGAQNTKLSKPPRSKDVQRQAGPDAAQAPKPGPSSTQAGVPPGADHQGGGRQE